MSNLITRSPEDQADMIQKLEESKKSLPNFNFFGDDSWEPIDDAIKVIQEGIIKKDEIYSKFNNDFDFLYLASEWLKGSDEVIDELLNLD